MIAATALFDFASEEEGEISFVAGDEIMVEHQTETWWFGTVTRTQSAGWFPPAFVVVASLDDSCCKLNMMKRENFIF